MAKAAASKSLPTLSASAKRAENYCCQLVVQRLIGDASLLVQERFTRSSNPMWDPATSSSCRRRHSAARFSALQNSVCKSRGLRMRIEQPIRRTVPSGRTSGARRLAFERFEDRPLDAAPFGALDYSSDAALCSDGFHDPPIALISQDRYYVQENCSVCVSGEGSAGNDLRYFWYLGPQPTESRELFVELGEYFWLSASQLDLGTGDYSLQLYVQDSSGASSETVEGALTITPSEPSFTIDADHSLDPGALVLNVQAHSYYPISTWTIDWGDGSTTQTDALGFELAAAHFIRKSPTTPSIRRRLLSSIP